jgi:NAD-dependent deacetylase
VDDLDRARAALGDATAICVLTGAGISTASGIPDFRGPDGVWTKDPAAERRATYDRWVADPAVRREAWARRAATVGDRPLPNPGHVALVRLEASGRLDTLVTQNVDALHRDAGTDPARLVEIHGTSREVVCLRCADRQPTEAVLDRVARGEPDPTCTRVIGGSPCGGTLKSATISFGQPLVARDLERAQSAARRCDLLLAVGSTLAVFPVAGIVPLAKDHGAVVVIVNRGPTAMDELADVRLDAPIETLLPSLVDGLVRAAT